MRSFIIHMSSSTARRPNAELLRTQLPQAEWIEAVRRDSEGRQDMTGDEAVRVDRLDLFDPSEIEDPKERLIFRSRFINGERSLRFVVFENVTSADREDLTTDVGHLGEVIVSRSRHGLDFTLLVAKSGPTFSHDQRATWARQRSRTPSSSASRRPRSSASASPSTLWVSSPSVSGSNRMPTPGAATSTQAP